MSGSLRRLKLWQRKLNGADWEELTRKCRYLMSSGVAYIITAVVFAVMCFIQPRFWLQVWISRFFFHVDVFGLSSPYIISWKLNSRTVIVVVPKCAVVPRLQLGFSDLWLPNIYIFNMHVFFNVCSKYGPVSSKDMQALPPSEIIRFLWKMPYVLKRINFPIFVIFIFWVITDFVHNFQVFLTDPKKYIFWAS